MRSCRYCGMPMEDDDLFCTRCGKGVPGQDAKTGDRNQKTTQERSSDGKITQGSLDPMPEIRPRREAAAAAAAAGTSVNKKADASGNSAGAAAGTAAAGAAVSGAMKRPAAGAAADKAVKRPAGEAAADKAEKGFVAGAAADRSRSRESTGSGKNFESAPERKDGKKSARGMVYAEPQEDTFSDEPGKGRKLDTSAKAIIAAAAVLVVVLGAMLFHVISPSDSKDAADENTIAVYEGSGSEEQNLNQGQQTPASGQAEETAKEIPDEDETAYTETQSSEQQTDAVPVQVPETPVETETPAEQEQQSEQETSYTEETEETPQETEETEEEQYEEDQYEEDQYEEDQYEEDQYEEEEDDEYGWTVDENGDEVYYPEDGEEYTDDDQTGSARTDTGEALTLASNSNSVTTQAQASGAETASGPSAIAGGTPDGTESEYILSESGTRLYTSEELNKLDDDTLQMAINEIYARHGRKFNTESMQQYFDGKSWYNGTVEPEAFDGNEAQYFNEYEIANRELMAQIRAKRMEKAAAAAAAQ